MKRFGAFLLAAAVGTRIAQAGPVSSSQRLVATGNQNGGRLRDDP